MSAPLFPHLRALFIVILLVTACRSTSAPVGYYALGALGKPQENLAALSANVTIGIGQVTIPDYLDRPQLVIRTGPHSLRIDEEHIWASPLSQEVTRVLVENLMLLTGSPRVARLPWEHRFKPDIIVHVQIFGFEANADGRVRLLASARLSDQRDRSEKNWTVDLEEQAAGHGHSELVAAQSRLIAELSRRVAAAIQ